MPAYIHHISVFFSGSEEIGACRCLQEQCRPRRGFVYVCHKGFASGKKTGRAALSVWTGATAFAFALTMAGNGTAARAQAAATTQAPVATAPPTATPAQTPAQAATSTDIVGTWQGTLHIPKTDQHPQTDLRLVLKISKTDAGALKATWYSIDQGFQGLPMASVSFQDGVLKFKSTVVDRSYEGKMSDDGKSITGTWMEGPTPIVLPFARATADTAWAMPEPPKPMAPDADPAFEVATIKPNNSGATQMQGLVIHGRQFLTRASSLQDLMSFAYKVQAKQIIGGPPWMSSDRYDIEALPDAPGVPNTRQIEVMIGKMLTDRFQLKFHHEQREMSAYVLEVAKGGEKLTPNDSKANLPGLGIGPAPGGIALHVFNAKLDDFTGFLQVLVLDRPVVNRTGLTGNYNFDCAFAPDDSQFNGHPPRIPPPGSAGAQGSTADAPSAPSLYEALEQQDGLKLTAEKTMVDVIVIDHVEKPSAN